MTDAIIYTIINCEFCADLKGRLNEAGVPFTETSDARVSGHCSFQGAPGTYLPDTGACLSFEQYGVDGQYARIVAYHQDQRNKEPEKIVTPSYYEQQLANIGIWSEELTIDWGGTPQYPMEELYEELDVTSTVPIPPEMPEGVTIALRDHKRAPSRRLTV